MRLTVLLPSTLHADISFPQLPLLHTAMNRPFPVHATIAIAPTAMTLLTSVVHGIHLNLLPVGLLNHLPIALLIGPLIALLSLLILPLTGLLNLLPIALPIGPLVALLSLLSLPPIAPVIGLVAVNVLEVLALVGRSKNAFRRLWDRWKILLVTWAETITAPTSITTLHHCQHSKMIPTRMVFHPSLLLIVPLRLWIRLVHSLLVVPLPFHIHLLVL